MKSTNILLVPGTRKIKVLEGREECSDRIKPQRQTRRRGGFRMRPMLFVAVSGVVIVRIKPRTLHLLCKSSSA